MVFNYQQQAIDPMSRKERTRRAVTAFMAYHSGYLEPHGMSREVIDSRANQSIGEYVNSENIPRQRAISCLHFDSYFSESGVEAICMDRHVLQRALHLPHPNSSDVINFPSPLTITVGQAGTPTSYTVTFADYSDFRQAYTELGLCISTMPNEVIERFTPDTWQTFGPLINADMGLRLTIDSSSFAPPEMRMSGQEEEMSINDLLCSTQQDGKLVKIIGQVLELGDARKRAIKIAWKCKVNSCGGLTDTYPDYFEDSEIKPDVCTHCGAGNQGAPKTAWVQDGAPNSSFVTFQRLMLRQTNTQMTTPPTLLVEVRGSHVHAMNQGEDVVITGIFGTHLDRNGGRNERMCILHATDLTRTSQDAVVEVTPSERHALTAWKEEKTFEEVMEALTDATASHVIGHTREKQALLLQAVGGFQDLPDSKRPFVHIMFIGDPGTAKSQLLHFAIDEMHPGSKMATGARASIPGLIGGKSENQRLLGSSQTTLSPGMLALIPPGAIAGIDELHAMGDQNVFTALNDAMETGQVSVQMQMKGTIQTRTPLLTCSNPKGGEMSRFDLYSGIPLMEQARLPTSFVSRFDLIFVFLDVVDEDKDGAIIVGMASSMNSSAVDPNQAFPVEDGYRKYLQVCRDVSASDQLFDAEAIDHFRQLFVKTRQNRVNGATVNFRWGAALQRLACAGARLDLSSTVRKEHIDYAHAILAESLTTKEPNMVNESGTGLGSSQTKVMDEILRLLEDWSIMELGEKDFGDKKDAHAYVKKFWELEHADFPCPEMRDFDSFLTTLHKQNKVERKGKNLSVKGL
ncbi:MAG: hypothetical protein CMA05_04680 [Euryarchaeota archaeon]|nr:hypothetical protein [Euryarchaeota archaeon]